MRYFKLFVFVAILVNSYQCHSQDRLGFNFLAGYSNSYFGNLFNPQCGNGGLFLGGGVSYSILESVRLNGEVAYHQISGSEADIVGFAGTFGLEESKITLHTMEGSLNGK